MRRNRDKRTDDPNAEEVGQRLAADPVFAIAQVVLLAKVMLTVLVFDPHSFDTFTLPKSVAAHATSLILGALLVWLIARHGRSVLFWSSAHIGAGALLLAFALATPFALDPALALFGTFKRYLGLTQMLDNVLLYIGVGVLFRDLRSLRLLAGVVIGTAIPVLAYALVQRAGLDPFKFQQGPTTVPISTLGNPDLAGSYLTIVGMTALATAFVFWRRLPGWALGTLALIGGACVVTLYATGVRAGVLGMGAGWLAIVLLAFRLPGLGGTRRWVALAFGAVLAIGVALSPIAGRLRPEVLQVDAAIQTRIEAWATAEKAVAARPVFGIGPDNYAAFYPANRDERSAFLVAGELQNSTHNTWLYVATSAGLVGFVALLLFVALLIERGLRAAKRGDLGAVALVPLFAYLGISLVNVNEIVLDWTFWAAAGVIAAAGARPLPIPRARRRRASEARWSGVLALAAAVLLVWSGEVPRLVAGEAMAWSEGLSNANRGAEAIPYGERAVSADPRRAEHWSTYGTALNTSGRFPAAAAAYGEATALQAWQPLLWRNLAITWGALGNGAATLAAAERATRADPYDANSHSLLASVLYDRRDYARAAAEGERALALSVSPSPELYVTTASAHAQLKELDRAEALFRDVAAAYPNKPLRLQLAAFLADRGKTAEAIAVLDALLVEFPDDVDTKALRAAITGK